MGVQGLGPTACRRNGGRSLCVVHGSCELCVTHIGGYTFACTVGAIKRFTLLQIWFLLVLVFTAAGVCHCGCSYPHHTPISAAEGCSLLSVFPFSLVDYDTGVMGDESGFCIITPAAGLVCRCFSSSSSPACLTA